MDDDRRIEVLEEEIERLRRAVEELSVLNDLAAEIDSAKAPSVIIEKILRSALAAVGGEQGVLTLVEKGRNEPAHTLVRAGALSPETTPYHCNDSLAGWILTHKKPLLLADPRHDERFRGTEWEPEIRTVLAVPLTVRGEVRALLVVFNKIDAHGFTAVDQQLLAIIGSQSAQVLENARLREQERHLLRMEEQVRVAADIQKQLLPEALPDILGYEIAAATVPAQVVGGDYYDFAQVGEHQLMLCLGDVSGKGVPASLLMANLQATLHAQVLIDSAPAQCLERCNRLLCRRTEPEKFVTLFYGVLDHDRHRLAFCNAGHNPPLLVSTDAPLARLEGGGPLVGCFQQATYQQLEVTLRAGDVVAIFSDGITEALSRDDEEYGEARLVTLLAEHRTESAQQLLERLFGAVDFHSRGAPQYDDITAVLLKRSLEP